MTTTWSFCKICMKYHLNWMRNNKDKNFETHLNPKEVKEAMSFNIYQKEIPKIKGLYMILADPGESLEYAMKKYPNGVFEP